MGCCMDLMKRRRRSACRTTPFEDDFERATFEHSLLPAKIPLKDIPSAHIIHLGGDNEIGFDDSHNSSKRPPAINASINSDHHLRSSVSSSRSAAPHIHPPIILHLSNA